MLIRTAVVCAALCLVAMAAPNWQQEVDEIRLSNRDLEKRVQVLEEKFMNMSVDGRRSRRAVTTVATTASACTCVGRPGAPGELNFETVFILFLLCLFLR